MRASAMAMTTLMLAAGVFSGCLGLVLQREMMEDMREPPETILREESIGFDHTFTSTGFDSTDYYNESTMEIDPSAVSYTHLTLPTICSV